MIKRRTRNNKISVNGMLIANPFTAASGLLASADEVVNRQRLIVINLIIFNLIIFNFISDDPLSILLVYLPDFQF